MIRRDGREYEVKMKSRWKCRQLEYHQDSARVVPGYFCSAPKGIQYNHYNPIMEDVCSDQHLHAERVAVPEMWNRNKGECEMRNEAQIQAGGLE